MAGFGSTKVSSMEVELAVSRKRYVCMYELRVTNRKLLTGPATAHRAHPWRVRMY